jgi:putative hydrolase of the HAD superfamily
LRTELAAEGIAVSAEEAERAFAAEIAFYLDHHLEGSDPSGLARLRDRCATVLGSELGLEPGRVRRAMLAALSFSPWEDAAPALEELRARGLRLVVVSNWDCSLPQVLAQAGLTRLVDGVVASAPVGAAKPDPRPFARALELAAVAPGEALHVGDSPVNDLEGARAAGIRGVLLARRGALPVEAIRSLGELPHLV